MLWRWLQSSCCQSTMRPSASSAACALHHHGRAVRLPHELVVAHPLQPHRPAVGRARQQRRVERDVVGAVVAVAAGAFRVDAADRARAACFEHLRERRRAAGTRPGVWVQTVSLPSFSSATRARGTDRAVRLVGPVIGRLDRPWRRRAACACLSLITLSSARQRLQVLVNCRAGSRQLRPVASISQTPRSAARALMACSSRSATTPRKLPSRTTATTPGIAFDRRLVEATRASRRSDGGRTTRPCTMPGSRTSCTYAAPPVTLAGMSRRGDRLADEPVLRRPASASPSRSPRA